MKIFTAGLICEINTFSPIKTTKQNFDQCYLKRGGNHTEHYWAAPLKYVALECKKLGWECIESLCAGAMPGGALVKSDYEDFRNEILNDLKANLGSVDAVYLHLHGALVADGYEDCEGDLLYHIRQILGSKIPVAVILDPHTHLTKLMSENATIMLWLKEYPHTDILECSQKLFTLLKQMLEDKCHPTTAIFDCKMIDLFPTTIEPMKSFLNKVKSLESKEKDILDISIVHGFPWSDVKDGFGTKISVITNNNYQMANEIAKQLALELFSLRGKLLPKFFTQDEIFSKNSQLANNEPIVIADFADNVGGGAPGDSTFILHRILLEKINNVAISSIWDPQSVQEAINFEGQIKKFLLGGKFGLISGEPIELKLKINKIFPDFTVNFSGSKMNYGIMVWLREESLDLDILINSVRCQTYSTECFSNIGIDPTHKRYLVVKSSEHYRSSFSKISTQILPVITPGALCPDFRKIHYTKSGTDRAIWPLQENVLLTSDNPQNNEKPVPTLFRY